MQKLFLFPFIILGFLLPVSVKAYDSKAQANAATMIIASCTWWQMGMINRSQIMNFSKEQYKKKHGNPNKVDWSGAIKIAQKIDKKNNLGCIN